MSENTAYIKIASLQQKGCIQILGSQYDGRRIRLLLPSEIDGIVELAEATLPTAIEDMDFFDVDDNRRAIVSRENRRCFYCFRALDAKNYVIEHIISRPKGTNSYQNVVAACRECNNKKNDTPVLDFIRSRYRGGFLSDAEFEDRLDALKKVQNGAAKPVFSND